MSQESVKWLAKIQTASVCVTSLIWQAKTHRKKWNNRQLEEFIFMQPMLITLTAGFRILLALDYERWNLHILSCRNQSTRANSLFLYCWVVLPILITGGQQTRWNERAPPVPIHAWDHAGHKETRSALRMPGLLSSAGADVQQLCHYLAWYCFLARFQAGSVLPDPSGDQNPESEYRLQSSSGCRRSCSWLHWAQPKHRARPELQTCLELWQKVSLKKKKFLWLNR